MQRFRRQIDNERQKQLQHHVERGVVEPRAAQHLQKAPGEKPHDKTAEEAAEQIEGELLARMQKRERSRGQKRETALEHHGARHVVEQGLPLEQRLVAATEAAVMGQRRDGHGIGGSHGAPERAGGRQGHGGQKRVQRRPAGSNDGEDESHGKRRDAPAVFPQGAGVHMARFVEVQRRDEQDEQQLRIDAPFQRCGNRQRERGAEGDLHKRQRQRRQELV